MKLIHTRTNQIRYFNQYYTNRNINRVYQFGVFYDTYIISTFRNRLEYNYQSKDSFSFHLISLIINKPLNVKRIIPLLNYHNCLYYNHTKFGLHRFASYKTLYNEKKYKTILNGIFDILVWQYHFNYAIKFKFRSRLGFMFKIGLDGAIEIHNKLNRILDFANQDLISMLYEIAQQNKKIEKKLTFAVIYNLFLR